MLTLKSLLYALKFQRLAGRDEGSCFGVTDPSRLRRPFHRRPIHLETLCESCLEGKHQCSHKVAVIQSKYVVDGRTGERLFRTQLSEVACQCKKCNPKVA
jgi:hypothetical protein